MTQFRSPIERLFAAALYSELAARPVPLSVQPQAPVGAYAADFMLAVGGVRVVVECDGHDFHERTPEQAAHDKRRDRYMVASGIRVLRFTGREITRDAARCVREVLSVLFGSWPIGLKRDKHRQLFGSAAPKKDKHAQLFGRRP